MSWIRNQTDEAKAQSPSWPVQGYPDELPPMQFWANPSEQLTAFLGREYCGGREKDPLRWHLSIKGDQRPPTWEQVAGAAHEIRPGIHFVLMVPPKSWWMNVAPTVLHLWETADQALVEEARANRMGHRPT